MGLAIVGGEPARARALASAFLAQSVAAVTIGDGDEPGSVPHLACDPGSAEQLGRCLARAEDTMGEVPAVVRLGIRSQQSVRGELVSMNYADWTARTVDP